MITRAIGHHDYVQVDTHDEQVFAGDRYLLCTDGFHGYVVTDADVVGAASAPLVEDGVKTAVALANGRGGRDNITVVLVAVRA